MNAYGPKTCYPGPRSVHRLAEPVDHHVPHAVAGGGEWAKTLFVVSAAILGGIAFAEVLCWWFK